MNNLKVLELSVAEAKDILVDFIADTLVNDVKYLKEMIREDGFSDWYGPVDKMPDDIVADRLGEMDLCENLGKQHDVDMVVVRLNPMSAIVVYDRNDDRCVVESQPQTAFV